MVLDASSGLAVSVAEQLVRLRGKFLGAAEMLGSGQGCSILSCCPLLE